MNVWISLSLTRTRRRSHVAVGGHTVRDIGLLCAASDLCNAADNLRAIGLLRLAAEIEAIIEMLDLELLLDTSGDS